MGRQLQAGLCITRVSPTQDIEAYTNHGFIRDAVSTSIAKDGSVARATPSQDH
jgi:hypothetical protein